MKILITGGAGFIGSHLSEQLLRDSHQVAIFDDLNPFYSPELKRENLESIRQAGEFSFYQEDICDEAMVQHVFEQFQPEAIVHLAARAGVRPSLERPVLYEHTNVGGTTVLLEAARRAGIRKFIFASSSSVYGATDRVPFREDDCSNLPCSPYAATKIAGEKICYAYSHLYDIDVVCLRLFTVYGPRQRPDLAIRKFASMMLDGLTIPFFGEGSSGRDYTYVDDIVAGITAALRYQAKFDVFNLGNSSPVTLSTMVKTLERALDVHARLEFLPEQPGDVPITFADNSKARKLLGFAPTTTFEDGISKFAGWHVSRRERMLV